MHVCLLYQRQNRERFGLGFFIFFSFIFSLHQLHDNFYVRMHVNAFNKICAIVCWFDLILNRRIAILSWFLKVYIYWHLSLFGLYRYRHFCLLFYFAQFHLICITFHTIDCDKTAVLRIDCSAHMSHTCVFVCMWFHVKFISIMYIVHTHCTHIP